MTATLDMYAPADLERAVLEILREEAPTAMTRRALALALRRRHMPGTSPAEVQAAAAATLAELLHAGRVERVDSGTVPTWTAAFATDDIELRVLELRRRLGGRPVVTNGGDPDDPVVLLAAPLSTVEALGR